MCCTEGFKAECTSPIQQLVGTTMESHCRKLFTDEEGFPAYRSRPGADIYFFHSMLAFKRMKTPVA